MLAKKNLFFLLGFLILGFITQFFFNSYIQTLVLVFMIMSMSAMALNLVMGVANQFSLGSAGFVALGAYTSAFLTKELHLHWSFIPLTALIGGLVAGLAGYLVALPSFRLKGDYLAIVTLGFAEIVRVIFLNWDRVGGARGYAAIPQWPNFLSGFLIIGCFFILTFLCLYHLKISWFGRNLWAINENEIAAEVMGTPVDKNKRQAFMISSFFTGVAGALYAHNLAYISPGSFGFFMTVNILVVTVLGGLGSISGTIVSAAIMTVLPEVLRSLPTGDVDIRMIVFPILLVLIMILRPKGLFGRKEIWSLK